MSKLTIDNLNNNLPHTFTPLRRTDSISNYSNNYNSTPMNNGYNSGYDNNYANFQNHSFTSMSGGYTPYM